MRTTNRGDVPAHHVAPSQANGVAEDVDDVVFDAGSLSFVQDWVVDGGDSSAAAAAAAEAEPRREDPRKTNPNRRLGVGAQPKKPKQDRVCLSLIANLSSLGVRGIIMSLGSRETKRALLVCARNPLLHYLVCSNRMTMLPIAHKCFSL